MAGDGGGFKASPMQPRGLCPAALIVAGPTCSGKSALALALAERLGGTVINADSMQVYRDLRVLTARPDPADEARVPHALYGVRDAAEAGSVAWWRGAALAAMAAAHDAGRLPILTGGTGLYFAALTDGLAAIPAIPPAIRDAARARLAEAGAAALHAALAARDPRTAVRLEPADGQRAARAWEVLEATGRGLASWQAERQKPAAWRFAALHLDPPRAALRAAIAERFDAMLAQGALDEVRALLARRLDPALPAMRAHGVPELAAHLAGVSLQAARDAALLATGRYTKRQATWFRHHRLAEADATQTISACRAPQTQEMEALEAFVIKFIHGTA